MPNVDHPKIMILKSVDGMAWCIAITVPLEKNNQEAFNEVQTIINTTLHDEWMLDDVYKALAKHGYGIPSDILIGPYWDKLSTDP